MTMTDTIKPANWHSFSYFIAYGELEAKAATHYLWQYANNVNSPILGESNGAQIRKIFDRVGVDYEHTQVGGGLKGTEIYAFLVRVADDQGQPIKKAVDTIKEIWQDLEDYPILDDEDYAERVEAANHKVLAQELKYHSCDWTYPDDDLDALAWEVLSLTQERESHDEDWFPQFASGQDVAVALEKLGFSRVEE